MGLRRNDEANLPPHSVQLAYIVGVALGDGNLSNPNGRATRLRVTCDNKYPLLIERIVGALRAILPENKVSLVEKKRSGNCTDISCYSNRWENILGWKDDKGSKFNQGVRVPRWIRQNDEYAAACLRGLIETDGCVYVDRGYTMINFTSTIPTLVDDFKFLVKKLGFVTNTARIELSGNRKPRYTVRICKRSSDFIESIGIDKR